MHKIVTFSLLLSSLSFANSDYIENFYKNGGERTVSLDKLIEKDTNLKDAIAYLEDKTKMITKDVNLTDPEAGKDVPKKIIKQSLPDYVNALKEFKKSHDKYKNPISAYNGIFLIKTLFGINKEPIYYSSFSKTLYETQKNICASYIDYGEIFLKGLNQKKDFARAKEIFQEGLDKKNCNGWQKNILAGKIDYIKMIKEK